MEKKSLLQSLGYRITTRQILFIVAFTIAQIGCNFCLDIPASVQVNMASYYGLSSTEFSLFYSMYFLPTIFANLLGGYLIDRWLGVTRTAMLFSGIAIVGICIFATGGLINIFWVMLLGRLIFGLGNEVATIVCVNYCAFTWYNHMMNFVATVNTNVSFLGTLAIFQTSPRLFNWLTSFTHLSDRVNLGLVLIITSLCVLPTAVASIWMTFLEPKDGEDKDQNNGEQSPVIPVIENPIKISDVCKFPFLFWTVCAFYGLYITTISFTQYSQGLFTKALGLTVQDASNALTVLNSTKIIMSIPISIIVDKIGRNLYFIAVSVVLLLAPHLLIQFKLTPFVAMFILGVSESLIGSAIMPLFGFTINDKNLIGSCYGIVGSVIGLCLFITPFIMGWLNDRYGFMAAQWFYISAGAVDIGVLILIWILDLNTSGLLNMSPKERDSFNTRRQNGQDSGPPESLASMSSVASRLN